MHARMLPHLTVETGDRPDAAVIWLHGLGADGHDFEPIVPELGLEGLAVRFVFPHAPAMPVTLNGGYIMPAWYDIRVTDLGVEQDEAGIRQSEADIRLLIEQERMRGIAAERILIAGFSQGAAMALTVGLAYPETLGGIVALSGYLPLPERMEARLDGRGSPVPVFMAHGEEDTVVPIQLGRKAKAWLIAHGFPVEWHVYPIAHSVCSEEVRDIGAFIQARLSRPSNASAST